MKPEFPIKVHFHEDNEEWILGNNEELACTLEWIDTDDPEERATVTDARGRKVRLKIKFLEIEVFELDNNLKKIIDADQL
jgi:hypothetical protein